MFGERGPIETLQIVAWGVGLVAGLWIALRGGEARNRVFAAWLSLLAALAVLRELDAHTLLNPQTMGDWGVRYRIDWWLSGSTPVLPRVLWLLFGAALITALVAPFLRVAPKFVKLLRARDGAWLLFAAGAAALFGGYACDDLLGRGQFVDPKYSKAVEEAMELLGATCFAAGVLGHKRKPLGIREARAERALAARRGGEGAGKRRPPDKPDAADQR